MSVLPTADLLGTLEPGTREWIVAELTLRSLRRDVYLPCPRLVDHLAGRADAAFDEFVGHLAKIRHNLGWTLPLDFGAYLGIDDENLWSELCRAAVARWLKWGSRSGHWIALAADDIPGTIILGIRPRLLAQASQLLVGRSPTPLPLDTPFAYQIGRSAFTALDSWWMPYGSPTAMPQA